MICKVNKFLHISHTQPDDLCVKMNCLFQLGLYWFGISLGHMATSLRHDHLDESENDTNSLGCFGLLHFT